MQITIKSFTAFGYEFKDVSEITQDEKHQAIGMLLEGLTRVSPEIRCDGNPLVNLEPATRRTEKTELYFGRWKYLSRRSKS